MYYRRPLGLADIENFAYIVYDDSIFNYQKIRHMKKNTHHLHAGEAAMTILLAIGFLGLVMFLSYLFISGNH
jgi:hypothetical protein